LIRKENIRATSSRVEKNRWYDHITGSLALQGGKVWKAYRSLLQYMYWSWVWASLADEEPAHPRAGGGA